MAVPDDLFFSTLRQLLIMVTDLQAQMTATHLALESKGLLKADEYHPHYLALKDRPNAKEMREKLDQLSPDTLLGMLRRFQGPPQ